MPDRFPVYGPHHRRPRRRRGADALAKDRAAARPQMSDRPSVARSARTVSLAVLGSRVLGLVREQLRASLFGASREFDAFVTAFRIPNLLRDLFARSEERR